MGQTNPLSSSVLLNPGDVLSFQINVCNNNGSSNATATVNTIVDTLSSLVIPSQGGWNAKYCQAGNCFTPVISSITGTAPNQVLTFTIGKDVPFGSTAAPGILTFDAQVFVSGNTVYGHVQNSAIINYNGSSNKIVNTPPVIFYNGSQLPTRQEVAP
jgi:hypothetical protein